MQEIYISIDIETSGPIPGDYSMLSFGAVAVDGNGKKLGTFAANLKELPDAKRHPDTMDWWDKNRTAWLKCRENTEDPKKVMEAFQSWIIRLGGRPVAVCYPAWDFTFIDWYFNHFLDSRPLGLSCLDMKSYAMAKLGTEFKKTIKKAFPYTWKTNKRHTHVALDDAEEQAELFIHMLRDK